MQTCVKPSLLFIRVFLCLVFSLWASSCKQTRPPVVGSSRDGGQATQVQQHPLLLSAGDTMACIHSPTQPVSCWGMGFLQSSEVVVQSNQTIVSDQTTNILQTAIGTNHVCILRSDRTVQCWGDNLWGQLGNGTLTNRSEPALVPNLANVVQISAGNGTSCAVLEDGSVQCWGRNRSGELGDGDDTAAIRTVPTRVVGISNVAKIASRGRRTCAVRQDGTVWCWGVSEIVSDHRSTTAQQIQGLTSITDVAVGMEHMCALSSAGTVYCMGNRSSGQVGDGSTSWEAVTTPTVVPGVTLARKIAAGNYHTCIVHATGDVWCWGSNSFGESGTAPPDNQATPTRVQGLASIQSIALGDGFSCAVDSNRQTHCWGRNDYGQRGLGTISHHQLPSVLPGLASTQSIAANSATTCVVTTDHRVQCWGSNINHLIDSSNSSHYSTPMPAHNLTDIASIDLGGTHACAVKTDGSVICWGNNQQGELADSTLQPHTSPVTVTGLSNVSSVHCGIGFSCALDRNHAVYCWGAVPTGSPSSIPSPRSVTQLQNIQAQSVSVRHRRACVVTTSQQAACFGETIGFTPVTVSGITSVQSIGLDSTRICLVLRDGSVRCRDNATVGDLQLRESDFQPIQGLNNVVSLDMNVGTCAILRDGQLACWGANTYGEMSFAYEQTISTPTIIPNLRNVTDVALRSPETCVIANGQTHCWGDISALSATIRRRR